MCILFCSLKLPFFAFIYQCSHCFCSGLRKLQYSKLRKKEAFKYIIKYNDLQYSQDNINTHSK